VGNAEWHPLPEWFHLCAAADPGAILLETGKFDSENFRSFLFLDPVCILVAETQHQIAEVFLQIDSYLADGYHCAGFVAYECGYLLQDLPHSGSGEVPLIRMSVFHAPYVFDHRTGFTTGVKKNLRHSTPANDPTDASIEESQLEISDEDYAERIDQVQQFLKNGHSYQVNFTDRVTGRFAGSPAALYRKLKERQPVSYSAYMDCGDYQVLSFSPELFYRASKGTITVKPMKGTWPRGEAGEEDRAADALYNDPKNRAEHVTIVDLLRNDLGKVCVHGSVKVDRLMQVERYSTLHQMTSTITGTPVSDKTPSEIFRALFPSGSITGAPKRRTMEIIRELEQHPRGLYTGAMGWFGPDGEACFNVAIRTVVTKGGHFQLGVGGGITLDSKPLEEYRECLLKASFLKAPQSDFHLIETMRAASGAILLLNLHMDRLSASARHFGIVFDEQNVRSQLAEAIGQHADAELRVRLTLDRSGLVAIQCSTWNHARWNGRILLSPLRMDSSDVFLNYKTSKRQHYDSALAEAQQAGYDEVVFLNENGCLTEGTISNLFLRIRGELVTPALECGVLPGVQRAYLLDTLPHVRTVSIGLADLRVAEHIWLCNALRGVRSISSIAESDGKILWQRLEPDKGIES
jgi:para-aminobenzoate synthetase/4-amino-4-deoxychorismate lyase